MRYTPPPPLASMKIHFFAVNCDFENRDLMEYV